jgi:hypothetical protein
MPLEQSDHFGGRCIRIPADSHDVLASDRMSSADRLRDLTRSVLLDEFSLERARVHDALPGIPGDRQRDLTAGEHPALPLDFGRVHRRPQIRQPAQQTFERGAKLERARGAPRQKWRPPPKAMCGDGLR